MVMVDNGEWLGMRMMILRLEDRDEAEIYGLPYHDHLSTSPIYICRNTVLSLLQTSKIDICGIQVLVEGTCMLLNSKSIRSGLVKC